MDQTVAYEGLEIQEIGGSSAFMGKDECQENPSKEPNSSSTEPWCAYVDTFREHQRDSLKNRGEFCHNNFRKYIRRIEQLDGSAPLHYVILTDAATALKNPQEFLENCIRYNIRFILWLDAQNAFKRVMATDGGTALKNPWELLENGFRHNIPHILWLDAQGAFKCVIVGDGGTGKTAYVKQMWTGEFEGKYEPTMGKHERMLEVPTKQGSTRFLCIDTPGHEKPGILRDQYYEGADCCIILCDVTAKQTQKDVPMWHDDLYRVCGNIPIVVCGNKVDVETKKVTFHMKKKLQYYEISAKSGYNLDKPFQYLAQKLAGYVEGANCI